MRCLELFAGAGGAALGLERAGMEHAALVEWDADACATLRAAGMGPVVEGDVRDLDAIEDAVCEADPGMGVDALWSSFPCQAFSSAGKREGAHDERNGWPWTVDAIDRFRPRWFMGENVTGLLQHRGDCACPNGEPEDCPAGYFHRRVLPQLRERFAWVGFRVLDAAAYGVPQHRRRVFIVAGPRAIRWPEPTHGPPTTQRSMFGPGLLPYVTVREALNLDAMIYSAGETGEGRPTAPTAPTATVSTKGAMYAVSRGSLPQSQREVRLDEPADTISAGGESHHAPYVRVLGGGRNPTADPREVGGGAGNAGPFVVTGRTRGDGVKWERSSVDAPSPAIRGAAGGSTRPMIEPGRRRLTVAECAALCAFPPDHPFQGTKTSRYRQVGNCVVPSVAEAIGRAVLDADT